MKKFSLVFLVFIAAVSFQFAAVRSFAADADLVIEDMEKPVVAGPEGTVDFGAGNGSSVEVVSSSDVKYSGDKAIKITFNAVPGGYMYVAKGDKLDAKNASWQVSSQDIKWDEYKAISFYMYGSDSKARVAIDIKDKGNEIWRYIIQDNFTGWKKIVCNFSDFTARSDWQPNDAEKDAVLAFPITSFQFEPLPESKGTIYIDKVELIKK
ncbi:MAG: hypothetical protein NTW13_00245 [Candidatus Omnitrophica bacterium]|nr:hypothetical protein [Candidatus Omnitrophota bacterium]